MTEKVINELDKIDIKPAMIQLADEIKSIGTFKVKINLHSDIEAEINIKVSPAENVK